MKLPIKLPFLKKASREFYYLALVLRDEKVSALIFKEQFEKIYIVSQHEEVLVDSLERTSLDNLVSILDKVITQAESKLPVDVQIKDTVFGVKDTWVEDKKIAKEYLAKLKFACKELNLTPIGFIVLSEAIAHLIQQEEAAPVTALITEVGKFLVTISLFRAGKLLETVNKAISENPMQAVDDALKEFANVEILPSRIILFQSESTDEKKSSDLSQKFIAHQWSKTLPFLQIPQISILPHGFDGKAIVSGAAAQLGYSLSSLQEDIKHHEIKNIDEIQHTKKSKHQSENMPSEKDTTQHLSTQDNFGFVLDKDITLLPVNQLSAKKLAETETEIDSFYSDPDHKEIKHEKTLETAHSIKINDNLPKKAKTGVLNFASISTALIGLKSTITSKLLIKNKLIFFPPALIFILIVLVLLYFFQLKATVILYVAPKTVSETEKITLSTTLGNDFTQNIISAKEITVNLNGSLTTEATGEKEIGDKAKGTVTLYNSEAEKKTFKEGTVLTSEKGLVYTIDKDVSVASASGDIFSGIKSGTAQVSITAGKIGTEYNLPSNSKFSIEDTDAVAAKNDSALIGGSKKKITIVTDKDVEKLKTELPKTLEAKAKEELIKKLSEDEELLTGFTDIKITKEELDSKVDSEAKNVKLSGTVSFKSVSYNKNDLLKFAQENLKAKYTKENLAKENIDTKLSGIKDKSDTELAAVAAINAGLLPKIDIENIKSDLKGKPFTEAIEYSKEISSQIKSVEINLFPNLPFIPKIMPHRDNNINITVRTN